MADSADTPTLERRFQGHHKVASCVHFSPNTEHIVSGGDDSFVMVWHFHEQKRAFRYAGHQDAVTWVRFSPSGDLVASASIDSTVRLWKPTIRGESRSIRSHSAAVRCVEFSHDGRRLVTASNDKTVKLFDTEQRKFIRSFTDHNHWVRCVSFTSDDRVLASAGNDKSVKIWDASSGKCIFSHEDLSGEAVAVAFQPSSDCYASSFSDGTVRLWDTRMHRLLQLYEECATSLSIAFHPAGNHLLVGSKLLDLLEGKAVFAIAGYPGTINSVHFSKNGDYFVFASEDQVLVWKTNFLPKDYSEIVNGIEKLNDVSAASAAMTVVKQKQTSRAPAKTPNGLNGGPEVGPPKVLKSQNSGDTNRCVTIPKKPPACPKAEERLDSTEIAIQQLTSQLDVLVQTVGVFEERLNQMEDRFDQILTLNHEILKNFTPRNTTN